jgi:hypothetical protein
MCINILCANSTTAFTFNYALGASTFCLLFLVRNHTLGSDDKVPELDSRKDLVILEIERICGGEVLKGVFVSKLG